LASKGDEPKAIEFREFLVKEVVPYSFVVDMRVDWTQQPSGSELKSNQRYFIIYSNLAEFKTFAQHIDYSLIPNICPVWWGNIDKPFGWACIKGVIPPWLQENARKKNVIKGLCEFLSVPQAKQSTGESMVSSPISSQTPSCSVPNIMFDVPISVIKDNPFNRECPVNLQSSKSTTYNNQLEKLNVFIFQYINEPLSFTLSTYCENDGCNMLAVPPGQIILSAIGLCIKSDISVIILSEHISDAEARFQEYIIESALSSKNYEVKLKCLVFYIKDDVYMELMQHIQNKLTKIQKICVRVARNMDDFGRIMNEAKQMKRV
jgi:hypothetical protein